MSTLKPIIKGNLISEAEAIAELEKLADAITPRGRNPTPAQPTVMNLQNGFYHIDKSRILQVTTPAYRSFLKDAGYGDLDRYSSIGFAKGILKYDQTVRDAATRAGLNLTGTDGDYVVNINHPNARKLVESLGGKLPTTALMYKLFIPYIKELASQNNQEAQATLKEMTDTSTGKAEWLEDLVKDKKKICIGRKEKKLSLPNKDGRFDIADMNDFGYPTRVKDQGEFYHWHVSGDERAAVRGRGSGLGWGLGGGPSIEGDRLGVRVAKIFP